MNEKVRKAKSTLFKKIKIHFKKKKNLKKICCLFQLLIAVEQLPFQMSSQAEIEQLQKILVYFQEGRHNWATQLMYHWGAHQHDYAHRVPSDECNVGSAHALRKPN